MLKPKILPQHKVLSTKPLDVKILLLCILFLLLGWLIPTLSPKEPPTLKCPTALNAGVVILISSQNYQSLQKQLTTVQKSLEHIRDAQSALPFTLKN